MSQNIFDATLDPNNDVKVNNFDWSHANNLTTQIGRVTPIFCDLVPAKTSFRVNPRFGLQFMPMVFPIQTRMKARISWFRYPLRALWKDYKDFVGNFREGLEEPYINFNTEQRLKKMASTGSLGDYLGMPTTIVGGYGFKSNEIALDNFIFSSAVGVTVDAETLYNNIVTKQITSEQLVSVYNSVSKYSVQSIGVSSANKPDFYARSTFRFEFVLANNFGSDFVEAIKKSAILVLTNTEEELLTASFPVVSDGSRLYFDIENTGDTIPSADWSLLLVVDAVTMSEFFTRGSSKAYFTGDYQNINGQVSLLDASVQDITLSSSPWYNSNSANKDKQQKILAYGFRAYEGIYNSFIRDNRNNPYYLNGQVQYNTWIPNDNGGEDNELYELRYANWEKDFLTTAVQSPQQGNAPLVGITTYTQTVANEDGTNTELIKTALVDEDGKKYGLSFKTSEEGLEGVEYLELDNGTKVRQARSLYDLATSGISIPDLRMVNCYQKFLELNMRKGYSYKDIVEGRFDVKVRYADLLLPEFFGGVSRDIDVNSVTQTVDQNAATGSGDYATALGSQSGIAGVRGEANANIECFCDEESIIMGILIVTPLPVYTQLLPKHFTYRGLMEHYQPEFNLIGFQPIKYNEVCPIQAYNANPDSLTETFGYNRPWYEYAQKYDVAHGLFRTSLSNFLMHRVFDQKPELAQSFLLVDPEQVTDVFAVTETTDKIYGQIWLDITCKLPIARVAIPRLD